MTSRSLCVTIQRYSTLVINTYAHMHIPFLSYFNEYGSQNVPKKRTAWLGHYCPCDCAYSAKRAPTLCVTFIYFSLQFTMQLFSVSSKALLPKLPPHPVTTHLSKHCSVNLLSMTSELLVCSSSKCRISSGC